MPTQVRTLHLSQGRSKGQKWPLPCGNADQENAGGRHTLLCGTASWRRHACIIGPSADNLPPHGPTSAVAGPRSPHSSHFDMSQCQLLAATRPSVLTGVLRIDGYLEPLAWALL
jgi:hypothetical protein